MRYSGLLFLAALLLPGCSSFRGVVTSVPAGDTLIVEREGVPTSVRVRGVSVRRPEAARAALEDLALGREAVCQVRPASRSDGEGRTAAVVLIEGRLLADELVRTGFVVEQAEGWWNDEEAGREGAYAFGATSFAALLGWTVFGPVILAMML